MIANLLEINMYVEHLYTLKYYLSQTELSMCRCPEIHVSCKQKLKIHLSRTASTSLKLLFSNLKREHFIRLECDIIFLSGGYPKSCL